MELASDTVILGPSMLLILDWVYTLVTLPGSRFSLALHTLLMHSLAMLDLVSKSRTFILVFTSIHPMYLTA